MANNFDRYRVHDLPAWKMQHQIGRGGFGVVYKEYIWRPGMLPELCAVKKIPLGIVDLAGDLQRYKREIAILASLVHHEWFVQFFGWYETKDTVFLAMEYMELGDLGKHLVAPWSESDTKVVAEQLLQGLKVLHEAGIAHRDLKPQNVFPILLDDGSLRIKIGDFGVSKSVTSNTHTSLRTAIGVPGYTAPEMIGHTSSYTNAVDLWSLGCLIYRMISGGDLFCSLEDIYRYKFKVASFPRADLGALGVSQDGVEFMERLLQANPLQRPTATDAMSCSWIALEVQPYQVSSNQVHRFRNRVQLGEDAILDENETIRPQVVPQIRPEAPTSYDSLPPHGEHSSEVATVDLSQNGKRPDAPPNRSSHIPLERSTIWGCQQILTGHSGFVASVAFSSDGKRLASGSGDTSVKLWNRSTGKVQSTLWVLSVVTSVAFSPDGKFIASGSLDKTVRLWDAYTEACQATLKGHFGEIYSVAISPDCKRIASGSSDRTIKLWNASTGVCLATLKGHANLVYSVAFSADGIQLASGSHDYTIKLWDPFTGACQATLKGHAHSVKSVAFSPSGKNLASGSGDSTIRLWDISTGECLAILNGHSESVRSVGVSPDGKWLVSGASDGIVLLWDLSTGACRMKLRGASSNFYWAAFSPEGKHLAVGSDDNAIRLLGPLAALNEDL